MCIRDSPITYPFSSDGRLTYSLKVHTRDNFLNNKNMNSKRRTLITIAAIDKMLFVVREATPTPTRVHDPVGSAIHYHYMAGYYMCCVLCKVLTIYWANGKGRRGEGEIPYPSDVPTRPRGPATSSLAGTGNTQQQIPSCPLTLS